MVIERNASVRDMPSRTAKVAWCTRKSIATTG